MVRLVAETTKTTPVLTVVSINTGTGNQLITQDPTAPYTGILDLYSVDGSISNIYFGSTLFRSNDTIFHETGLEDNFPTLYTEGGISVKYIYMTTVDVNHKTGTTSIRIGGYQQSISYTFDGSNAETTSPNTTFFNATNFLPIGCNRLCLVEDLTDSIIFKVRQPILSYPESNNITVFTDASIGSISGQNLIFDLGAFGFDKDTPAEIGADNTISITGILDIVGLESSVANLESWNFLPQN